MIAWNILFTMLVVGYVEGSSIRPSQTERQYMFRKVRTYWDNLPQRTKECTADERNGNCPDQDQQPTVCVTSFARYPSTRKMCHVCQIQHPYNYKPGPCPGQILNYLASFFTNATDTAENDTVDDDTTNSMNSEWYSGQGEGSFE